MWVYRSLGDGDFEEPVEIALAIAVDTRFADGDASGDGVIDLIATHTNSEQVVAILSTP